MEEDDKVSKNVDEGIRSLAPGFIRFSIKARDTEDNLNIHDSFREFCDMECDSNYTQGLKILLKNYDNDYRFDTLYELYQTIKMELEEIKVKLEQPKKKEKKEEMEAF